MIKNYYKNKDFIEINNLDEFSAVASDEIWIDLHNPSAEEIAKIDKVFQICLPTKDEMYGLEISSRLYRENDNYFMTIFIIVGADGENPAIEPITFILVDDRLITLRYIDPQPFRNFISNKEKISMQHNDGKDIMFSLIENISERIADILEKHAHELDTLSKQLFKSKTLSFEQKNKINFEETLSKIGHYGDIISKTRESLSSISRLVSYIRQNNNFRLDAEESVNIDIIEYDIKAMIEHAKFVNGKINFLLEATLGMIGIQQNNIIKIFTVATVMFLPPTLLASIYGMNFDFMPELKAKYGYFVILFVMIISAYLPFKFFKKKGWI